MLADILITRQVVFNGVVTGLTYGVLGVGLVLVYRSSRVINFAHGQMGAFAAAILALLVIRWDINFYLAFAAALAAGAALGAAVELSVVRRLFTSPRIVLFAATLGVAQLMLLFQFLLPDLHTNERFPTPLDARWRIGGLLIRSEHLMVLVVVPVITVALAWFLERSKQGTAIRAAADNPDAARLSAISVKTMSTLVWVLAGLLATVTAVLVAPFRGGTAVGIEALGPTLLLRALAAALVARMRSLPITIAAGTAIGVAEAAFFFNATDEPGLIDAALFVVVLAAVLLRTRQDSGIERESISFTPRFRPVPANIEHLWWVRRLPLLVVGAALALAAVLPMVVERPSRQYLYASMLLFAIVAMSLTLLTGWAGQLSLGQFAFVGLGAMLTTALVRGMHLEWLGVAVDIPVVSFEAAVLISTAVCIVAAMVVGIPALRVRGLFLAVTTLAFAVMAEGWLLDRPFLLGDSGIVLLPRARWGDSFSLESQRTYYYVCLGALAVCALVLRQIRCSGIGRSMRAVRDNEVNAAAFTVSPTRMKLTAFGVAGALAGLAGGLIAGLWVQFGPGAFDPDESLRVVAVAVIGGLSSAWGAVLGALWVIGLPALFEDAEEVQLLASGVGLLILLMYLPAGLVGVAYSLRDAVFSAVSRRRPPADTARGRTPIPARVVVERGQHLPDGVPALAVSDVTVSFGGVVAVNDASLEVGAGEVVGLIGTNGAGKSTMMNAIGGFIAARGRVELAGRDISRLAPHRRARLGLGRTFQTADLFPDLTVRDTIQVALEARSRAVLPATLLSLPSARRSERRKRAEADELIAFFGLGRYGDSFINELSTGTRRICELACLIALEAKLLCLDEPTAGVAQRETEAFAPLVQRIREELGASLLVIEHDMPFIMGISDRVYCLEAGSIIAEGPPDAVRNDPVVIASYLGTDERAIARSDARQRPEQA
ncbi:ABC transporter permease subunit [Candidatus Poriferisocius sp.]|uniref:ABC transporter permease subunit n=1 Tax=Candidatus Poriferisocius sp. TaxID=3101276 RepID=UPI003B019D57